MINWSNNGGAFISARELEQVLIRLEKIGLLGNHTVLFEGFNDFEEDVSLSFSDGSVDVVEDWLQEILVETSDISPAGFSYPLSRIQQSNANNGYKSGIHDKKAGLYFAATCQDMIQEELYEFGLRIPLNGIIIKSASGGVDGEETEGGYSKAGTWHWNIEINNNSIYKEVEP